MLTEILLGLAVLALAANAYALFCVREELASMRAMWGNVGLWATDYQAGESTKALKEIAHYMALDRRDKNEANARE
jgi:hypothetical protein